MVVRQVVGHGRLIGEHAYRQLDELYRGLHWYVNCFQPSMKLVAKQVEVRTIHRIYDAAKTPLQRVLLSGVLLLSQQQELRAVTKALDPLRLFEQVEQLQQATVRYDAGRSSTSQLTSTPELLPFHRAGCAAELVLLEGKEADELPYEEQKRASVLDWRRTSKDPFAGQWQQILSWVQANPTRSSGDVLRELQCLFPGRYERSHLRTLQRGIRKIRMHVLQTQEEAGSPQGLQSNGFASAEFPPPWPTCWGSLDAPSASGRPVATIPKRNTSHCLTKIFLSPLQASLFPRFCSGLSSKTASSLISSGAGEEHGLRERERGRFFGLTQNLVIPRGNEPTKY